MGVVGGYEAWDRWSPHSNGPLTVGEVTSVVAHPVQSGAAVVMPDVVGLDKASALEAISSSGLDPSKVRFTTKPYAAPAASIVAQDPLGGTTGPSAVTLAIAGSAKMPAVAGLPADAAEAKLQDVGAVVQMHQVYARGVAVGSVISSIPAAGAPLTGPVTLSVSSAPAALFLTDLSPQQLDCSTGSQTLDGKAFDHSVSCTSSSTPEMASWSLAKQTDGVVLTLGLSPDSDALATGTVLVLADGKVVRTLHTAYGPPRSYTLPLQGVSQLTFQTTGTGTGTIVLADPHVIGSATGITALQGHP